MSNIKTANIEYYKPELNEFHVGFEYEKIAYTGDGNFKSYIFNAVDEPANIMDNPTVRVKYLDREDIESLGWKLDSGPFDYIFGQYQLEIYGDKPTCYISSDYGNIILFQGIIKNKSELKKLMKQLEIE